MTEQEKPDLLGDRLAELRARLKVVNPADLASKSGMTYMSQSEEEGALIVKVWDRQVMISFPELIAKDAQNGVQLGDSSQALLLYYLTTCDGTPSAGQWISFSDLPNGRFYNQAFQGYTGGKLSQVFGNNSPAFCQVCEKLGGKRVYLLGDAAYVFNVLPFVDLMVVTWWGDEEFDASYQVLFDASAEHHLPTDTCAVLGSNLTHKLTVEMESLNENRY